MQDNKSKINLQTIDDNDGLKIKKQNKFFSKKRLLLFFLSIIIVFISAIGSFYIWYLAQLRPLDSNNENTVLISIVSGSTPLQIAEQLKSEGVIRNASAFQLYLRVIGKGNLLQYGEYQFTPSNSVYDIVDTLLEGSNNQFEITFYTGATLVDNTSKPRAKKTDVTTLLENAGYSKDEITNALNDNYDSPLFDSKPADSDLEGYIYGDTYKFEVGTSVSEIFEYVFDKFYSDIETNGLIEKFESRGLNLYEGITLASIIQREVNKDSDYGQVAQVFYSRLEIGMILGSDVTYQYIADKLGVDRDINLDSPYNTRRYAGLTPGPISSPGLKSLLAVANPSEGDYLYFLSGDDDITYFARTYYEHEMNIVDHCKVKCSTL